MERTIRKPRWGKFWKFCTLMGKEGKWRKGAPKSQSSKLCMARKNSSKALGRKRLLGLRGRSWRSRRQQEVGSQTAHHGRRLARIPGKGEVMQSEKVHPQSVSGACTNRCMAYTDYWVSALLVQNHQSGSSLAFPWPISSYFYLFFFFSQSLKSSLLFSSISVKEGPNGKKKLRRDG